MILFALLVLAAYAVYVMTPRERDRLLQAGLKYAKHARAAALEAHQRQDPFRELLRARTTLAVVAPALAALNVIVFVMMVFGPGAFSDPATLIGWGANFGPRTTNGEWSRLVTALFVHVGVVHLLVNVAGMLQVGLLLERLLGPLAVALVYVAAGAFSSLENVSSHPIGVSAGASGAIFGLYGLLIASVMWSFLQRGRQPAAAVAESTDDDIRGLGDLRRILVAPEPVEPAEPEDESASNPMAIPMSALKPLAPAAGVFLLYTLVATGIGTAELSGLVAGFAFGLVFASSITVAKPGLVRVGAALAVALIVIVSSAFMLRGLADVRPEIARVVDIEDRTAGTYQTAVEQFKLGTLNAEALAKVIDVKITPELRTAQERLKTLGRVPPEHQPLVDDAQEYLRLRDESWRLRAAALHRSNMGALRQADKTERASLEALERLKPSDR